MPRPLLPYWQGMAGGEPTDFDRACSVTDYIGCIEVGEGHALVLGDDPYATTWWPLHATGGGVLVRRLWGDQTALLRAIPAVTDDAWTWEREVVFDAGRGQLVLFDSACSGDRLPDGLHVDVGPGKYLVSTANLQPDDHSCGLAHRLLPLQ